MGQLVATLDIKGVDYRESQNLTQVGGCLITLDGQRRITMSAGLPEEEKVRGIEHLLSYLDEIGPHSIGMYVWMSDSQ